MDVPALLVFVSGFVVCAGVVFLISIFGAKEETFEEALAKQRKANEREKKSKDKKKDENSGKKSKNWRMKKKGERDDKQDGLVSDKDSKDNMYIQYWQFQVGQDRSACRVFSRNLSTSRF